MADNQTAKKDLLSRIKNGGFSASIHGKKPLNARNFLSKIAIGATLGILGAAPSIAMANADSNDGVLPGGSAEVITTTLTSGKPLTIINGGGVQSDILAEGMKGHVNLPDEVVGAVADHIVNDLTGTGHFDNPAVAFPNSDACIVYQHPRKVQSLSATHDYLYNPDGEFYSPEGNKTHNLDLSVSASAQDMHQDLSNIELSTSDKYENEKFIFLHEVNHCHILTDLHESEKAKKSGKEIDPNIEKILDLTDETKKIAKQIAQEIPGTDAERMEYAASSQVYESMADVFGLLAAHQNTSAEALRAHAERLIAVRDVNIGLTSTHDTKGPLLEVYENADELFEQVNKMQVFDKAPSVDPETMRVRGTQFNQDGFDQLTQLAVKITLENIDEPDVRMKRMHAKEVVAKTNAKEGQALHGGGEQLAATALGPLNADQWQARRDVFQSARPGGEALETIKERLIERAIDRGMLRSDSKDDHMTGPAMTQ